jgi:hypothetical protein
VTASRRGRGASRTRRRQARRSSAGSPPTPLPWRGRLRNRVAATGDGHSGGCSSFGFVPSSFSSLRWGVALGDAGLRRMGLEEGGGTWRFGGGKGRLKIWRVCYSAPLQLDFALHPVFVGVPDPFQGTAADSLNYLLPPSRKDCSYSLQNVSHKDCSFSSY